MIALGILLLIIILLIVFWNWDWFIPTVEQRASATLGRKVTIEHLHVRLGRQTTVVADNVALAGPDALPGPVATVDHLTVGIDILPLIRHLAVVVPLIDLDHPEIHAIAKADGTNNWTLATSGGTGSASGKSVPPKLGVIRIERGHAHIADPRLKANFDVAIETRNTPDPAVRPLPADQGQIVATARGTYAGQPITGHFTGGAILSLRDKTKPYPIDLRVANGSTHVSLAGTVEQPLTFGGARLKLTFAGPDMSLLYPLTNVPIPQTGPYSVAGNLDYAPGRITFRDFEGRVGSSDLNGTITYLPGHVPTIDANLMSRRVDLADLGGFIGSSPPRTASTGAAPRTAPAGAAAQKDAAGARSNGDVLPTTSFNMPKIRAANVHLAYKGRHIENRNVPLDDIVARLDIDNGMINLKQLDFAVGTGTIFSHARLDPSGNILHTEAHVDFHKIDVSRLMQATHAFRGQGILGGQANLATTGNSIAQMLGNGTGGLTLVMEGGGDVSALLSDIAGLEFGNALLSALGVPDRSKVQCFVADLPLHDGIMSTDAFLLQTGEARSTGQGTINFKSQTLDYTLTTRSSHLSVGSLPGAVNVTGKLGRPSILPGKEILARAGAAAGLGFLLPPLALLPTIQFGVGEKGACAAALATAKEHPASATARISGRKPH